MIVELKPDTTKTFLRRLQVNGYLLSASLQVLVTHHGGNSSSALDVCMPPLRGSGKSPGEIVWGLVRHGATDM